jgi:hypothetical protein
LRILAYSDRFGSLFYLDNINRKSLRNVGELAPYYTESHTGNINIHSHRCGDLKLNIFRCDRCFKTRIGLFFKLESMRIRHNTKNPTWPCHSSGFPPRRPGYKPRSVHVGFVVDKMALGQVFSEHFPLPILIPPTVPHSSSSILEGWYNRPVSGRRTKWTQSHRTPRN